MKNLIEQKYLSVIIPLYKGEEFIEKLVLELELLASYLKDIVNLEVIFVDDGSPDETFEAVKRISTNHFKFQGVRLSRNFKSYIAILAGVNECTGDYITILPQDLQESTDVTVALLTEIQKGYDVVWAVRRSRSDPWLNMFLSKCFHKLMNLMWSSWPNTGADVFMITKPIAHILEGMQEKNSHITGQILWMGFKQTRIYYDRHSRKIGKSGWKTFSKFKLAVDIITQFSYTPIHLCTIFGIVIAVLAFMYAILIVFNKIFFNIVVSGWSSLMLVMLLIGGMQLIFLGIIGEYLWRAFDEVRKRPAYIVIEKINQNE